MTPLARCCICNAVAAEIDDDYDDIGGDIDAYDDVDGDFDDDINRILMNVRLR